MLKSRALLTAIVIAGVATCSVGIRASDARACSFIFEDETHVDFEAPPGGLWWLRAPGLFDVETVVLISSASGESVESEVVFAGVNDLYAVRVPADAIVGDSYTLDDLYFYGDNALFVDDTDVEANLGPVASPSISIEVRETLVGYAEVASASFLTPCGRGPGVWWHHYERRPWMSGTIPPGHLLDVTVRALEGPAFDDVPNANVLAVVGRRAGELDQLILAPPPGDALTFNLHARLIRASDASVSETLTLPIQLSGLPPEERLELGCSSTDVGTKTFPIALLLSSLLFAVFLRRRPRT